MHNPASLQENETDELQWDFVIYNKKKSHQFFSLVSVWFLCLMAY